MESQKLLQFEIYRINENFQQKIISHEKITQEESNWNTSNEQDNVYDSVQIEDLNNYGHSIAEVLLTLNAHNKDDDHRARNGKFKTFENAIART